MFIHWFPGHMTKAIRMMKQETAVIDSIIYVLDARAPVSCVNEAFDEVIGKMPRIYILNKADLVEPENVRAWLTYFRKFAPCIAADSLSRTEAREVIEGLIELNAPLLNKYKAKGVHRTLRAMVLGVPNTGKSTLINSLIKGKKTITGNKPGVTRGKQWVAIDKYIDLLDSPGVLYPDFRDQGKATRLALLGSIRDEVLDIAELGLEAVKFFLATYPDRFAARYGSELNANTPPMEAFKAVAVKRGYLSPDGEPDYDKTGRAVITDLRKGYLGKISMEKPL